MNNQLVILQDIIAQLKQKLAVFFNKSNLQTGNSWKVFQAARDSLGSSLVPLGDDPSLGCAVTVNRIFQIAIGKAVGGDTSTAEMFKCLLDPSRFLQVPDGFQLAGDVIISPTGSPNVSFPHGHVGIVAYHGVISNSSVDGKVHEYFTVDSWKAYYQAKGGYPVLFFRVK